MGQLSFVGVRWLLWCWWTCTRLLHLCQICHYYGQIEENQAVCIRTFQINVCASSVCCCCCCFFVCLFSGVHFSPLWRNFSAINQVTERENLHPHSTADWTHRTSWHCGDDYFCITTMNSCFYFLPTFTFFPPPPLLSPGLANLANKTCIINWFGQYLTPFWVVVSHCMHMCVCVCVKNHLASISWSKILQYWGIHIWTQYSRWSLTSTEERAGSPSTACWPHFFWCSPGYNWLSELRRHIAGSLYNFPATSTPKLFLAGQCSILSSPSLNW